MSGQGFFAVVQVLMSSVPAVIYVVAGWLIVGGDVGITAGAIVAFTNVQARLLNPLVGLMRVALDLQTSRALFARIFEYLDLVPAVSDIPDPLDVSQAPGPRGRSMSSPSGSAKWCGSQLLVSMSPSRIRESS